MSLVTLTIAIACNSLVALFMLPRLVTGQQTPVLFRSWLWLNEKLSLYGWLVIAVAVLAWAYWPHYGYEPEREVRLARILLILLLVASIAALVLQWIPAGPAAVVPATMQKNPGLASALAWGAVAVVVGVLCLNGDTRDRLLGDGRVLSLVGLGLLLLVLVLIPLGWWAL